jgi:hypothetical protein
MTSVDTVWYHMPFAARFVQTGSITSLHYVDPQAVTVFFPANSELLHALGILFLGSDVLSPFLNIGWLSVMLLAAWCIGRPFQRGPLTLTGTTVLLATPGLVATQPGGAYTDIVSIALLASSMALLLNSDRLRLIERKPVVAIAALAAGLALGTKFTVIAPVAALTVGLLLVSTRGTRLVNGALWIALVALTGGFWYGRNLSAVGNPLPSLAVNLGPFTLPSPPVSTPTSSVAQYLSNGRDWHDYFLPGLRLSLGPAWWAILALVLSGLVLGTVQDSNPSRRMLALVGWTAAISFLFTPQFLTLLGAPVYFPQNFRYSAPALLGGLLLIGLVPPIRRGRMSALLLGVFLLVLLATQLDPTIWPTAVLEHHFAPPARGVDSVIALIVGAAAFLAGCFLLLRPLTRPRWRWTYLPRARFSLSGLVAVVILLAGFGVEQLYLDGRYTQLGSAYSSQLATVYQGVQGTSGTRIALAGALSVLQYPLYGPDLSNYVQFVGQRGPHGAFSPIENCPEWRRALHSGRYQYLVSTSPDATIWTHTDPGARLVRQTQLPIEGHPSMALFRLPSHLDLVGCRPELPSRHSSS